MKKKYLLILILIATYSYSQEKGIIYYGYIQSFSIGNKKGYDYNSYLIFNKKKSYYVTAKDSLEKIEKTVEEKVISDDENNRTYISSGMKVSPQGDQVVYSVNKNIMWSNLYLRELVYVKETVPVIDWVINNETKKIGKFNCKKATASFRGRNYIAWFTTEIPVPFGPWKLNGLPGLILEAYDTHKFVYWYFKSVEYPSQTKEKISSLKIPMNLKVESYKGFKSFQLKQINSITEKLRIAKKMYPDVKFHPPELIKMFIECE